MCEIFGNKLKEYRLQYGLKQKNIAYQLNVHKTTISNWEKGKQEPSIKDIKKLATILEVSTDELLDYQLYDYNFEYQKIE